MKHLGIAVIGLALIQSACSKDSPKTVVKSTPPAPSWSLVFVADNPEQSKIIEITNTKNKGENVSVVDADSNDESDDSSLKKIVPNKIVLEYENEQLKNANGKLTSYSNILDSALDTNQETSWRITNAGTKVVTLSKSQYRPESSVASILTTTVVESSDLSYDFSRSEFSGSLEGTSSVVRSEVGTNDQMSTTLSEKFACEMSDRYDIWECSSGLRDIKSKASSQMYKEYRDKGVRVSKPVRADAIIECKSSNLEKRKTTREIGQVRLASGVSIKAVKTETVYSADIRCKNSKTTQEEEEDAPVNKGKEVVTQIRALEAMPLIMDNSIGEISIGYDHNGNVMKVDVTEVLDLQIPVRSEEIKVINAPAPAPVAKPAKKETKEEVKEEAKDEKAQ